MKPANLKYRFNWTSPIAVSSRDANTVYLGASVVFKTTDGGDHWTAISPDLTRNDKSKQVTSGGSTNPHLSGARAFKTALPGTPPPTASTVVSGGARRGPPVRDPRGG